MSDKLPHKLDSLPAQRCGYRAGGSLDTISRMLYTFVNNAECCEELA